MRVAFYAPLKPPDHPVPSGDRRVALLLVHALACVGHEVEVASRFMSREPLGDSDRQARLQEIGHRLADRLVRRLQRRPAEHRPAAWLTYHLYYKAPDYIGPRVCRALDLPYLVAEASVAPKRAGGPWDIGHRATLDALALARHVITLNPADAACLPEPAKIVPLKPFLETAAYEQAAVDRDRHRHDLAGRHDLDPARPWLAAVAMMRPGDKLDSYEMLARALDSIRSRDWQLLVVGDGPARPQVESALASLGADRLRYLGQQSLEALPPIYAAADLLVWPAVREAFGMALLEAQASGLPVVAGNEGGVAGIVSNGVTGQLVGAGDIEGFAAAIAALLDDPARRSAMALAARQQVADYHGLETAARQLGACLKAAVAGP